MKGLFRAFEREGVDSLLIGGQAAILYGAAHFTQDLDLWIRPSGANVQAFLRALARIGARVHKLTPPLSPRWILRGHGFHFVIPQAGRSPAYLDVMGYPPRVGSFGAAAARSRQMQTPWGTLPVVGIEDLVEMKKTNRPGDYEVISRLVRIRLGELGSPSKRGLEWAIRNSCRIEDLLSILTEYRPDMRVADPAVGRLLRAFREDGRAPEGFVAGAARSLDRAMAKLLDQGRRYWLPRIRDLRTLRAAGKLLPEGTPVQDLLG